MSIYEAIPVEQDEFEANELGGKFAGGTVVDGISDQELDQPLLVVRYEEDPAEVAKGEWETHYHQLHDLVKTVRTTSVISSEMLLNILGKRDEIVQQTVTQSATQLILALVNAGGVGWVETPITEGPDSGGIFVQTFVLAVPEFKAFNALPRPKPVAAPGGDDGEEQSQEG